MDCQWSKIMVILYWILTGSTTNVISCHFCLAEGHTVQTIKNAQFGESLQVTHCGRQVLWFKYPKVFCSSINWIQIHSQGPSQFTV